MWFKKSVIQGPEAMGIKIEGLPKIFVFQTVCRTFFRLTFPEFSLAIFSKFLGRKKFRQMLPHVLFD